MDRLAWSLFLLFRRSTMVAVRRKGKVGRREEEGEMVVAQREEEGKVFPYLE